MQLRDEPLIALCPLRLADSKRAAYRASQPASSGGGWTSYAGSSYSYSRNTGYSYGYGSSEWTSQTANPYARPRMSECSTVGTHGLA